MQSIDPSDPTGSGMVLTFDDEFNTMSISSDGAAQGTRWTNHLWFNGPGNGPGASCSTDTPDALSVSDGILTIKGWNDAGWKGGVIESVNSSGQGFTQKFGYFETRARLPNGQGFWPQFWLINSDRVLQKNPSMPASEIDILEGQMGNPTQLWTTLHRDSGHHGADPQNRNNLVNLGIDLSKDYHRYGALWDPNSSDIVWYFDGTEVTRAPKYDTTDLSPMMVIAAFERCGWMGAPDSSSPNPGAMSIDYVRVWQFPDQPLGPCIGDC